MRNLSVLATGGDTETLDLLMKLLREEAPHIAITTPGSDKELLELSRAHSADCILSCCNAGMEDCSAFLDAVKDAGIYIPVVTVADGWDEARLADAQEKGVYEFLTSREATENAVLLVKTLEHAAEHGRLARALREERKNLDVILNSIGESVIIQDKGFKVLFQNKASIDLVGDHKGEDCFAAFEGRKDMCEVCPILDSFRDGMVHREEKHTVIEGRELYAELTGSTLTDLDGNIIGGVKVVRDITERKLTERQKTDLVAMVSHDFKSPLSVVQGYAELIINKTKGTDDAETFEMASAIKRSCSKLIGLVEDFLTMSRMESGSLALNPVPVALGGLVDEAVDEFSAIAGARGITVTSSLTDGLPELMLDRTLMERAVSNLARNAISYTPKGGQVVIGARKAGEGGGVEVYVSDTGPGIPESERDRVFDKYYRLSATGQPGGTGLGLAVVKAVARAHGGVAEVESVEGKGSTFRIVLPYAQK